MFRKSVLGLSIGALITCAYSASKPHQLTDFSKEQMSPSTLIKSGEKTFENMTFSVLQALSNPQFMVEIGKKVDSSTVLQISSLLNQASVNFATYALPQLGTPTFVIYKFTVTPRQDLVLPELASLYEELLDKDELITPTIEDYFHSIKAIDQSKLPFERFVALCATELKTVSDGRRGAISDFLKRTLDNLKQFSSEISLELMGTGTWDDEVVLEFKTFIDGRARKIELLLQ